MYLYARARAKVCAREQYKATLRPLLKIYNYLCGPALELKLHSKKTLKDQLQKLC